MKNDFYESVFKKNEYIEFLREFDKEVQNSSDRGIALICGSIIDQLLSTVLRSFFVKSEQIEKELFKGNGPLADFDSKIKMAYYLGLISKNELSNIVYLQRIRNKFAHQIVNISFENNDIKNMCSNFKIPKNCYMPTPIPFPDKETGKLPRVDLNPIKKDTSAKDRFIYTFRYLFVNLGNRSTIEGIEKREEYNRGITTDTAILMQNEKIEGLIETMEMQLDKMREIQEKNIELKRKLEGNNDFNDELEEIKRISEEKVDNLKAELENVKVTLAPIIKTNKYVYDVIKNSMED